MEVTQKFILEMEEKVLNGGELEFDEAVQLLEADGPDIMSLFASANRIRDKFCGDEVHLCGIVNAKSGACSEDCVFCSQAVNHPTQIERYSLMNAESLVDASRTAAENGAKAFGIVTAWKGVKKGKSLDIICDALRKIKDEGRIVPDLSLGLIDDIEVAQALADAGAVEYNHNLESGPSFFRNICTTHDYSERVRTIEFCKQVGMRVCSGGIFGLGESPWQRAELAYELKKLEIQTVPLNFYHHTDGNAVDISNVSPLQALEALKVVAMFRFVMPRQIIKVAGGRETTLGQMQSLIFLSGANSTMVGHYLTTTGRTPQDDFELIAQCGLVKSNKGCGNTEPQTVKVA